MKDRVPPHSSESEQGMLGCVLLDGNLAAWLQLDWFYDLKHRKIAEVMTAMAAEGRTIDQVTFPVAMIKSGNLEQVGGLAYLSSLPDKTPSAGNFAFFKKVLQEHALRRHVLQIVGSYTERAYDKSEDASVIIEQLERDVMAARKTGSETQIALLSQVMSEVIDELEECFTKKNPIRGIASGFADLDKLTSGFRSQQMVIIAARPSVGKTSLAMNMAENIAVNQKIPTGVFSLEMSAQSLMFRMTCGRARVSSYDATSGQLGQQDFTSIAAATREITRSPLHICDKGGITIGQLSSLARLMVQSQGVKIIFVDYLGLIRGGDWRFESRAVEVSSVSNGLKALAKELDIPVVVCCQLNRATEKEKRPPVLSDLRESGSIEQDADLVLLLHREKADDATQLAPPTEKVIAEVAKQRNGATGKFDLCFRKRYTQFVSAAKITAEDAAAARAAMESQPA